MLEKIEKEEMLRKLITFTPRMWKMIGEVKDKNGYVSYSAVIHQAVVLLHTKTFAYQKSFKANLSPEERVKMEDEEKKARKDLEVEKKIHLCQELGGSVEKKEDGSLMCNYFTYSFTKRFSQSVPINMLGEDLLRTQYAPSKEEVFKLSAEGKVEYKDEIENNGNGK